MPRNGSGSYQLPAGNPVTSGTLIEASWANTTLSDIASAVTDSLARSGEGGMTGPMRATDGTVSTPSVSFVSETATGFYRAGATDVRFAMAGVDVATLTTAGVTVGSTKVLALPDGTAAAPALTNTGDTNTGVFFPDADTVAVSTAGTERLRVDASGNLGLGVTPSAWGGNYRAIDIQFGSIANTNSGNVDVAVTQNAFFNGTNWITKYTGASKRYVMSDAGHLWLNGASATAGNAISFTQAMTLDASGNLLVGTTTATVGTAVGCRIVDSGSRLEVASAASTNSDIGLSQYSTGAAAYRFYVGYGGTIYATSATISAISDQRFKENIRDLDVGLNAIMALKPRKFDWKADKGKDIKDDRGFIAQEFEQVFPDLIDEWKDPAPEGEEPYKAVRADLIPVLVKAIQEQQAIIQSLTARIEALEAQS